MGKGGIGMGIGKAEVDIMGTGEVTVL